MGIAQQLTSALSHIHAHNVINLDVKPGNVLFRKRQLKFLRSSVPEVVLCDFGIARDARYPRTGLLGVATPEYVSPEHASEMGHEHQPVDFRSDIFSLGVLLYEILTGALPFDSIALIVDPHYTPTPPREIRSSIPPRMEEIVMRAIAKNPAHRFQTADEMLAALKELQKPLDWQAIARRTFAGMTLVASFAAVGFGISRVANEQSTPTPSTQNPTATVATPTKVVDTKTPIPSLTPTATAWPTATRLPTLTPTNTYPPPTATPQAGQTLVPTPTEI
jgi:serine/threonine protein kinase